MSDQRSSVGQPVSAAAAPAYADVILPRRLHHPFTYEIPADLKGKVVIGQPVIVPFGSRDLQGLVISVHARLPQGAPDRGLKAIRSLAEASQRHQLTPTQLDLSRWVAERYAAPWGQCIKLILPSTHQAARVQPRYLLTEQGLAYRSSVGEVGEVEAQVLKRLSRRPKGISAATLERGDKSSVIPALRALIRKGLVLRREDVVPHLVSRPKKNATNRKGQAPSAGLAFDVPPPIEAASWPATMKEALSRDTFVPLLVQGVRDTRVWCLMQAVRETSRRGRSVVVITGDVENASRLAGALTAAGEYPHLLHSGLSAKERATVWRAVQDRSATILIGTRMAIFAPIEGLGLVWVEGEDDLSLKEEQVPRYHAREVARRRAVCDQALLVLASNHPSLESWSAVRQGQMTACVYRDPAACPNVQVIDLKGQSNGQSSGMVLSLPLCDGIREALRQKALTILYLNRKGFASVLHCRDCGAMPQCDACSVAVTFYKHHNHMRCHYCGRVKPVPDHCLQCHSLKLEPVGAGTERIEESVRRMFPQARIGRADGETIRRSADAQAFLHLLAAGEIDIVIGTQMLFRLGLPRQASFVAVPDADAGLHIPDFRSAERTYHGLVDAVELAKPVHAGGSVLVQTRFTDHPAMVALARGDESVFFDQELSFREMLQYPPSTHLIRLDVSGTIEPAVAWAADRWATLLRAEVARHEGKIIILGPSPAPHAFARGRYCQQILVKSISVEAGSQIAVRTCEVLTREARPGGLRLDIDVDPVSMT
ncbi:MAG: Helicase PriA essential for oriC/DnaA-independent DNA replication [Nitrospira sp.]|jgi:primosomal protein N' (replication factor Y)|nr:MAG: Helicase PriA essential for oriC/DnaA-independent DNA replication [Nitrospira sp.]